MATIHEHMREDAVNHRYSVRRKANCKVTLSCEGRVAEGEIVNLSIPGCQLETSLPLKSGHTVQLWVHIENQSPLRVDLGIVRWSEGAQAGIEFIRMTEEDQTRLRRLAGYVDERMPQQNWSERITCMGASVG